MPTKQGKWHGLFLITKIGVSVRYDKADKQERNVKGIFAVRGSSHSDGV